MNRFYFDLMVNCKNKKTYKIMLESLGSIRGTKVTKYEDEFRFSIQSKTFNDVVVDSKLRSFVRKLKSHIDIYTYIKADMNFCIVIEEDSEPNIGINVPKDVIADLALLGLNVDIDRYHY